MTPEPPNVISLRGATVPGSREPDPLVVSLLERLLEEARAGMVHGIGYAVVCDENLATGWAGKAESHRMLAGTALLNYRLAHDIDEA